MLNQKNTYKFLPALATFLCACSAQAVNFHFGIDIPVKCRAVRPVCTVYDVPRVRSCHSVIDSLIGEIERDLRDIDAELNNRSIQKIITEETRLLTALHTNLLADMRTIKKSWYPWISGYIRAYRINAQDLEAIADEVRDVRFALKRIQREGRQLFTYELIQVCTATANLADILASSHYYRTSDLRDVVYYFSEIRRTLANV